MKRHLHALHTAVVTVAACAAAGIPTEASAAAAAPELRAAIIYNIIRFVELHPPRDRVVLCVPDDESVARPLQRYHGRNVPGGRLEVRVVRRSDWSADCRIAYVGSRSDRSPGGELPRGTLVIGEGSDFLKQQGSVAIVSFGRQVGFEVNTRAGARAGAVFSSRLLRLARAVRD